MKEQKEIRPPLWATRLLSWYCKPQLLEDLHGDLNEYFQRNVRWKGIRKAKLIYVIDVFKFFRLYTIRKPEFINLLINWIMIGSYIKTSGRNIVRNKLFSAINIVGLAISMSVGLLMISILSDLFSYDDFHEKKNRTYRVITKTESTGQPSFELASTSVKAGRKIQETIPLTEDLTIIRNQFSKDAHIDNKVIPVSGHWADASFFRVFTFPLIKGDATTALKEPYSIVLTEKAAKRMFGDQDAFGKQIIFDSTNYVVTGIMKDVPKFSHIQFEALVSFSTLEIQQPNNSDGDFLSWKSIYNNYVYFTLPPNGKIETLQANLDQLSLKENLALTNQKITLSIQELKEIAVGRHLANQIGPNMVNIIIWVLVGLTFIVILSACFNYTNLSIARSIRRSREVGIRKVIGAFKFHVLSQFMCESVIIALFALAFAVPFFFFLRSNFLALNPHIEELVTLTLSVKVIFIFIIFATAVGLVSGFLPALFFSRINVIQALKDASSLKMFRHITLRKGLIVAQYTFSLIFITTTIVGYFQYKNFLAFNLGFTTENIINIKLQGNKANLLAKELSEIPEVSKVSKSLLISSLGSLYGEMIKYRDPLDSANAFCNMIDENYLPIHGHQLLAGRNFITRPNKEETEVIVNEELLRRFNIGEGNAIKALGEMVQFEKKKLIIVGVVKDFHYGTALDKIEPFAFRYSTDNFQYLNAKINSTDWQATMKRIEKAWRKVDDVHPLEAAFYTEQIENAYSEFSVMVRVIGFLSFLAICISSLGLFGMVVFTTETKLREISIRKVMGANEANLIYLLSKGFLLLLIFSAIIALPITYFVFDKLILPNITYHLPIGLELFVGFLAVSAIAFIMIGSQTLKVARSNPAEVLKAE
jgi:putative ABC transport system permease protein